MTWQQDQVISYERFIYLCNLPLGGVGGTSFGGGVITGGRGLYAVGGGGMLGGYR